MARGIVVVMVAGLITDAILLAAVTGVEGLSQTAFTLGTHVDKFIKFRFHAKYESLDPYMDHLAIRNSMPRKRGCLET